MKYYISILPVAEKFIFRIEDEISMKNMDTTMSASSPFFSSVEQAKEEVLRLLRKNNIPEENIIFR